MFDASVICFLVWCLKKPKIKLIKVEFKKLPDILLGDRKFQTPNYIKENYKFQ